jgi:prevent-host-death family protein
MLEIGEFEAKNRFAEILRRVESGETFLITRQGKTIAMISAPENTPENIEPTRAKEALEALRALKQQIHLTPEEVAELKAEGRR